MNTTHSAAVKNICLLLSAGIDPERRGLNKAALSEAHRAGLITWNRDYTGQGWSLAPQGRDVVIAMGAI